MPVYANSQRGPQTENQDLAQAAVNCYLSSLIALGKAAADLCPHIGTPYQNGLMRLRQRLAFEPTASNLVDSVVALESDLSAFSRRVNEYYEQKTGDIAALLEVIAGAVETFETRDQMYLERLALIARQMESALGAQLDAEQLRAVYQTQLSHLNIFVDRLSADNKTVFDGLRNEIGCLEDRLLRAEAEASIDPLTSLVTRRELERLIRERIAENKLFSLLLFDVRSLRSVNERFGQEAGDQVLKQFGARLVAQVRPRDIVARWGGDEFAVIFDCAASDADTRARQIAQWVSGRYPLNVGGQEWKPEIDADVTVVEYHSGEILAQFISRVSARTVPSGSSAMAVATGPEEIASDRWRTM